MTVRAYRQVARVEATERTTQAIVAAAQQLFREEELAELPLDRIAARAGVSTRTVLRHFGSKEGLMEAAMSDAEARVRASREAPPGDLEAAIRALVDHYEEMGDEVVRRLAASERYPLVRQATESGERLHREWVEAVFAADLEGLSARRRRERLALLATVTDVYTWHLLRRRHGLARAATETAIRDLARHAREGEPR
ncbi:MAG TPA: TetR/AcrR family transcriptional regulator [Solirubrobacterales bacterium]